MFTARQALISVSDKTGIVELARALAGLGVRLLSTGGTARLLTDAGLAVTEVSAHTGFPEMLDGRVKTLHPKIHGGLLARRDLPAHVGALREHGIATIDILCVNLYPFEATVAKPGCTLEDAIENIDIGGPAMVRSAAKNWQDVAVLTDASQYEGVLAELKAGGVSRKTKFALSVAAVTHAAFPGQFNAGFVKVQDLRYGENPHQSAAFYRERSPAAGTLATAKQLQGKELSYNNIADADAAWECVRSFEVPACVIVKHANPCGVAVGASIEEAYAKAWQTDPTSAFGGIIALNRPLDEATAQRIGANKQFVEVLIAPSVTPEARTIFAAKQNVRVLEVPAGNAVNALDFKRVGGGLLVQSSDIRNVTREELRVVTKLAPTPAQLDDLLFAWKVAKFVKSNAIVFCGGGMTLGVGAGQMSRLDSARIASIKAGHAGLSLKGSAVASDAFFPFRDGLDVVIDQGASCVIQPGGSMRDEEVIAAADERGIAMVLTGVRHFRH